MKRRTPGRHLATGARLVSLLLVLLATACQKKEKTPLERGQGTFVRLCAGCHGMDGRGTNRPGFKVPPRDLTDALFQQRTSDEDLKRTIRQGKGQMPSFGPLLPPGEIDEVVAFIRTLPKSPPK